MNGEHEVVPVWGRRTRSSVWRKLFSAIAKAPARLQDAGCPRGAGTAGTGSGFPGRVSPTGGTTRPSKRRKAGSSPTSFVSSPRTTAEVQGAREVVERRR